MKQGQQVKCAKISNFAMICDKKKKKKKKKKKRFALDVVG